MTARRRIYIFLLAGLLAAGVLCADTKPARRTIDERKARTEREIKRTRGKINKNLADTERELARLEIIEGELRQSIRQADELRRHSEGLRCASRALADTINADTRRLERLRDSYGRALRALRRQRKSASDMAFIFSASSFRSAGARIRYLSELSQWQKQKSLQIKDAVAALQLRRQQLDSLTGCLTASIDSLNTVQQHTAEQKNRADAMVSSLRRQRRNLDKVLAEQERQYAELDRELARIIEEEQRLERERNKGRESTTKPESPKPESSFADSKGKLPAPLNGKSTVSSAFGRHSHAELSKVEVQNNGIDFDTEAGTSACAVYDGTVSLIIVMDGFRNVVLLRHGEYLTVYAGIERLNVKKGDTVKAGQALGTIYTNGATGRTRLHFEIRHEKEKLDPSEWLNI